MNTNLLQIHKAVAGDKDTIYRMICDLENTALDRAGFDRAFDQNLQAANIAYFIARLNNEPVGMVSCHIQLLLHHVALVSEIQEMYVEPRYRSQQIGHELMEHVTRFAKENGAIQIEVTSRNRREDAHRFYQREGFAKSHVKLVRYFNA